MTPCKIMAAGNLDDIMGRLACFKEGLHAIHGGMEINSDNVTSDALYSACDHLGCILRDFQADIDCAADYMEGKE